MLLNGPQVDRKGRAADNAGVSAAGRLHPLTCKLQGPYDSGVPTRNIEFDAAVAEDFPTGDFRVPVTTQRRPANIFRRAALCVPNRPAICDGVDSLIGCNLSLQSGTTKNWLVLRFYVRKLNLRTRAAYKE